MIGHNARRIFYFVIGGICLSASAPVRAVIDTPVTLISRPVGRLGAADSSAIAALVKASPLFGLVCSPLPDFISGKAMIYYLIFPMWLLRKK